MLEGCSISRLKGPAIALIIRRNRLDPGGRSLSLELHARRPNEKDALSSQDSELCCPQLTHSEGRTHDYKTKARMLHYFFYYDLSALHLSPNFPHSHTRRPAKLKRTSSEATMVGQNP